jgi:alginate O-acetyltransferase complex protein AlgI
MLFNSFEFLIFFVVVTTAYFIVTHRFRWGILLFTSCCFYMAFVPIYILILGFTIVIDYFAGLWIESARGKKRRMLLMASIVANVGILAFFKYYNFFNHNIDAIANWWGSQTPLPFLTILLPIGLSFHTFQAMSYTIEVFRGNQTAERHFGIYALYVMFYPQLVAGPIERPQNMLHQFHEEKRFDYQNLFTGLKMILWGLFKKVVIADRFAFMVDEVYKNPTAYNGFTLVTATILFALQIYCDFSGYSDIALGTARVMGFKLMTNFRQPYFSKSISEFWSRWHISLSTWFKDYVYIPLGGNRVSTPRWYFNLLFVFTISGLWHGANWTFIVWGALNGIFLIVENICRRSLPAGGFPRFLGIGFTFTLVCICWIFFRASSVQDAWYIVTHLGSAAANGRYFSLQTPDLHGLPGTYLGLPLWKFSLSITLIPLLLIADHLIATGRAQKFSRQPTYITWPAYILLVLLILFCGTFDTRQFIYFQF